MDVNRTPRFLLALPLAAGLVLPGAAFSQEPTPEPEQRSLPELIAPEDDVQREIIRLFHEVEQTLEAIDIELADAGSGQTPLGEGQESGIDRLLRSSQAKGEQAVSSIDKILELAQQLQGGGT
jgi:hypothetical protein